MFDEYINEYYGALELLSEEMLIKIIEECIDIDATTEAMFILGIKREVKKEVVLEKGLEFLKNNEADAYFQVEIMDVIDEFDFEQVLNCLKNRKERIQPYLLGKIMSEMIAYREEGYICRYLNFVKNEYKALTEKEKNEIEQEYKNFIGKFDV